MTTHPTPSAPHAVLRRRPARGASPQPRAELFLLFLLFLLLLGLLGTAAAQDLPSAAPRPSSEPPPRSTTASIHPLSGIGRHALASLTGWNGVLQAAGLAATPVLVASRADARFHNFFNENRSLDPWSAPAVYAGYLLPVAGGGALVTYGLRSGSRRELAAGSAVLQATLLAVAWQSALKSVTGREHPRDEPYGEAESSGAFRFGLLRGGVHWGWPSGHLMTNVAAVTSLQPLYPESRALRIGSAAYLGYLAVGVGVHEGSSMHWLSDIVAGSLMGWAIGRSVGTGFAGRIAQSAAEAPSLAQRLSVAPLLGPDPGATLVCTF